MLERNFERHFGRKKTGKFLGFAFKKVQLKLILGKNQESFKEMFLKDYLRVILKDVS